MLSVISIAVYLILRVELNVVIGSVQGTPGAVVDLVFELIIALLIAVTLTACAIAAVDYSWVRYDHMRKQRMSLQELRDENKESDGDPALKAKRRALAEAARLPAYIVFNDRTLIEMAQTRPTNLDQMAGITGVGAKKQEQYGRAFLEVINGEAEAMHPTRRKLAGRTEGDLYDRLMEAQSGLHNGADGLEKPENQRIDGFGRGQVRLALEQIRVQKPLKCCDGCIIYQPKRTPRAQLQHGGVPVT